LIEDDSMGILGQFFSILGKSDGPETESGTETAEHPEPQSPAERRARERVNARKGTRALIIDDSATMVAAIKKMLQSVDYVTYEAMDAESGVELAQKEKPDLIFLDIVLPGMNGFAALRHMRKDPLTRHIPIIMISGNEQATEEFYAKRIGADDFMKKPFSRHEVFARIEELLDDTQTPRRKGMASAPTQTAATPTASIPANPSATIPTPPTQEVESPEAPTLAPVASISPAPAPSSSEAAPRMTALEARKELTAMGLQYFDQEQFVAAIRRGDILALELFAIGGGVSLQAADDRKSALKLAFTGRRMDIVNLLQTLGASSCPTAATSNVAA
jgi:twitching motility two-component system response regulator PilH